MVESTSIKTTTFNYKVAEMFTNTVDAISDFLDKKTDAFIQTLIVESYVTKEINNSCLATSKNWWMASGENYQKYAIHIDDAIKPLNVEFGKELEKDGYKIIHVTIDQLRRKVLFYYENKFYSLEDLVSFLGLTPKTTPITTSYGSKRSAITQEIVNWFYKSNDLEEFLYVSIIEDEFIFKYFNYASNLDVVWVNEVNGRTQYFVGEVKFKGTNKDKTFMMNIGERNNYLRLSEKTDIKVVAIALLSDSSKKQDVFNSLLKGGEWPLFYYIFEASVLKAAVPFEGKLSQHDKDSGKKAIKVVAFSYENFKRVVNFDDVGRMVDTRTTINNIIKRNCFLFKGINDSILEKHYGKLFVLYSLMMDGYDIDYRDYLKEEEIDNNILNINGKKVWFKYMQSEKSWNLIVSKSEFENAKAMGVDSILLYRNTTASKLGVEYDKGAGCKVLPNSFNNKTIEILGILDFEVFEKEMFTLSPGIPAIQKNLNKVMKGLTDFEMDSKYAYMTYKDVCYFLQVYTNSTYCPVKINPTKIVKTSKLSFANSFFEK